MTEAGKERIATSVTSCRVNDYMSSDMCGDVAKDSEAKDTFGPCEGSRQSRGAECQWFRTQTDVCQGDFIYSVSDSIHGSDAESNIRGSHRSKFHVQISNIEIQLENKL